MMKHLIFVFLLVAVSHGEEDGNTKEKRGVIHGNYGAIGHLSGLVGASELGQYGGIATSQLLPLQIASQAQLASPGLSQLSQNYAPSGLASQVVSPALASLPALGSQVLPAALAPQVVSPALSYKLVPTALTNQLFNPALTSQVLNPALRSQIASQVLNDKIAASSLDPFASSSIAAHAAASSLAAQSAQNLAAQIASSNYASQAAAASLASQFSGDLSLPAGTYGTGSASFVPPSVQDGILNGNAVSSVYGPRPCPFPHRHI